MSKTIKSALKILCTSFLVAAILTPSIKAVNPPILQQSETFDQHLAKGKEALATDDRATAYWELESARIKEPDRAEPYTLLARLRIRENRLDEAIEKITIGLKYQPDNASLHAVFAEVLWRSRKTDPAAAEIDKAYRLGETSSEFFILMSEIMLSQAGRSLVSSTGLTADELRDRAYSEVLDRYHEALKILPATDPARAEFEKRIEAIAALKEFQSQRNDKSFTPPKPINAPSPHYTDQASKQKITGTVRLAVFVNENGETVQAVVIIGLGFGLDESAVNCATRVKWNPAMKDGKPIPSCVPLVISYSLL